MEFVVIAILVISVLVALFQPLAGLFAFFLIAYIRPQDFYPYLSDLEPAKWIIIVTSLSFLFYQMRLGRRLVSAKQNGALLFLFGVILLSGFVAVDKARWMAAAQDFFIVCLIYFLIINLINTEKKLRIFYWYFLVINIVVALRFYLAYKSGNATYHGSRPGDASFGFLANADDLGLGMVVVLPLILVGVYYAKNVIVKGLSLFISGVFILAALGTQSRGTLFGVITVYLASVLINFSKLKIKKGFFVVGLIIALLFFGGFCFKYRWTIQNAYISSNEEEDSGKVGRMATWEAAKQMIKSSPVIGVGRGNYVAYWKANLPPGQYGYQVAHNVIYEVTSETGILGLCAFLVYSLYGLLEIGRFRKKYRPILEKKRFLEMMFAVYFLGVIGFYFNGMFITVGFYWHIYVMVAIFVTAKTLFLREVSAYAGKKKK